MLKAITLLSSILLSSIAFGADKMAQLSGEWKKLSFESHGKTHTPDGSYLLLEGQIFRRYYPGLISQGKYVLSSNGKHNNIDFIYSERVKAKGIYEIKGDILRLCFSFEKRPTQFSTSKGDEYFFEVYQRINSDKPLLRKVREDAK